MNNVERYPENWHDIDTETYDWSVKIFAALKKLLSVNMTLHGAGQIEQGDIFLFNHFSRFETFIPQFLIHQHSGAYCCAIASSEFFEGEGALQFFLKKVGAVPHDHPRLFQILAAQILRGRKVVIFPEGGMVKDRRVLDSRGRYSIFSRLSGERRKQHSGAAVLAQGVDAVKAVIRKAYAHQDHVQLQHWQEQLHLDGLEPLLAIARKPTLIVPANITFYPIRSSENLLHRAIELFSKNLSLRDNEELLIEGNILLQDTDMDLRLGEPIDPYRLWRVGNYFFFKALASEIADLDDVFNLFGEPRNVKQKLLSRYFKKNAQAVRNAYMQEMYANVTINLSHLASTLIMHCLCDGRKSVEKQCFYNTLYGAIKRLQENSAVNLHHSLLNPEEYENLPDGHGKRLETFIANAERVGLVAQEQGVLRLLPRLSAEYDFDTVRMENAILVYNNEAAPLRAVRTAVVQALESCEPDREQLIAWFLDDERRALSWSKQRYLQPRYADINRGETATADPMPFLLLPQAPNGIGVLLIHGLLAGPAELKNLGAHLQERGYTVLGVRLKGHGTSPYDLREQSWKAWYASAQKGLMMLRRFCRDIAVVGFSTGGALALRLAAAYPDSIKAIIAAAVPVKFVNLGFMLLPLLQGASKLLEWTPPSFEGMQVFIDNAAEHPQINYRHVPVRSLFELRKLIQQGEELWTAVKTPTLILHAKRDPVVELVSSKLLFEGLGSVDKRLILLDAEHHGILMDNTGGCWAQIDAFLAETAAA